MVLHGKDAFLRMEWTRRVVDELRQQHGSCDEFRFDGTTASLAEVLDEARTLGLMSPCKVVVVDGADAFIGAEERRRALERYAAAPVEQTTLILRAPTWRPGNFDKLVTKVGIVQKCEPPADAEAQRWAISRAQKRHDSRLDPDAAALLVERLGADLGRIDMELGKLAVNAQAAGTPISKALVREQVGAASDEQAWAVQEAILSGSVRAALEKVDELVNVARAPEVMVMWSIEDLFRKMHSAAAMLGAGRSEGEAARALKLWGESTGPLLAGARKAGAKRCGQAFVGAVRADAKSKTGLGGESLRGLESAIVLAMRSVGS